MDTSTIIQCRACLLQVNKSGYDLLTTPELAEKYAACTTLTFNQEVNHFTAVCHNCYNKILDFYAFQIMCIASDKKMREQNANWDHVVEDEKPIYDLTVDAIREELIPLQADAMEKDRLDLSSNAVQIGKRNCGRRLSKRKNATKKPLTLETPEIVAQGNDADLVNEPSNAEAPHQLKNIICTKTHRSFSKQNKIYKCTECSKRFFAEHKLIAHKRRHDGLVAYPCPQADCGKGFNRLYCLTEHLKQHEGTNTWHTCPQTDCGKRYKHKPTLMMHLRKYHKLGPELKKHICEICGKIFKTAGVLNDHRYTHKEKSELPHACQEANCLRRFSNKEKLKIHMLRHAGIKNFVCPYCGMRKTTRNELNIHINYHTLERTWSCRFCTKVCNSAGNLKMHVRTVHERAKDYKCSYCEKTFAKSDTRKYHEMTHTGEKPHKCNECGKSFTQPAALRTHRKIHLRQSTTDVALPSDASSQATVASKLPAVQTIAPTVDTTAKLATK